MSEKAFLHALSDRSQIREALLSGLSAIDQSGALETDSWVDQMTGLIEPKGLVPSKSKEDSENKRAQALEEYLRKKREKMSANQQSNIVSSQDIHSEG